MNQSLGTTNQSVQKSACFVHDWLIAMRGGEKVLEALVELFPEAPIYTLFYDRSKLSPALQKHAIHSSFLQHIPGIRRWYRWLLPLFPLAIRSMNVGAYDVVISSSHCVAKAVRTKPNTVHICYCHTPMRYLWEFSEEYLGSFPAPIRWAIKQYFKWLKKWDIRSAQPVTAYVANSHNIAEKIFRYYGKQAAAVVHPPVDVPEPAASSTGDFFLVVSALVPYKRTDLAIEAFNRLRRPLKIVGDGPERQKLEQMVRYKGIEFEGWLADETLWNRYAHARALIFPGEEDFGIVPVEAQMFGKPVLAFGRGGIYETVIPFQRSAGAHSIGQCTGLFFDQPKPDELVKIVEEFDQLKFDPHFIQKHARRFSRVRFQQEMTDVLKQFQVDISRSVPRTASHEPTIIERV